MATTRAKAVAGAIEALEREKRGKAETEARIVTGQSLDDDRQEGDTEEIPSTG